MKLKIESHSIGNREAITSTDSKTPVSSLTATNEAWSLLHRKNVLSRKRSRPVSNWLAGSEGAHIICGVRDPVSLWIAEYSYVYDWIPATILVLSGLAKVHNRPRVVVL